MKKIKKVLYSVLAMLVCVSALSISAFAAESKVMQQPQSYSEPATDNAAFYNSISDDSIVISKDANGNLVYTDGTGELLRVKGWSNILSVKVYDRGNGYWRVSMQNIGLDWVDKVTCNIKIYEGNVLQYNRNHTETVLKQLKPRNIDGYLNGWTRIVVSNIVGTDEGDVGYLPDIDYSK